MDFEKAAEGPKAWKEIWGCGQGIGAIKAVTPVETLVARAWRPNTRPPATAWRSEPAGSAPRNRCGTPPVCRSFFQQSGEIRLEFPPLCGYQPLTFRSASPDRRNAA